MKKKLLKRFVDNVVVLSITVLVVNLLKPGDVTLRLVLIDVLIVLVAAGLMTGLDYLMLKKENKKQQS